MGAAGRIPPLLLVIGLLLPSAGRADDRFDALHEVLRHFEVAFVDRANPSALLLGALEGLHQAAPECRIRLHGQPELFRLEAGGQKVSIRRQALRDIPALEKALMAAAGLVVDQNLAQPAALQRAMVRQLVAHCGDPWSVYLDAELYPRLLDDGSRQLGSTGMLVELWGDGLRVLDVQAGSPAAAADLRRGMRIDAIAGRPAERLNELEALALMRGPLGAEVEVVVAGEKHRLKLAAEPKRNMAVTPIEGGLAHVHIMNFRDGSGRRLAAVMRKLGQHFDGRLKGLVLDLRGNPGGLVTEGTAVAGLFLPAGEVVRVVSKKHMRSEVERNPRPGPYRELPMVVLVDHRSASVSEIVAMALRDYDRCPLVGEKTLGKGTVQVVLELMDGSALKLSTGRYYSPKGTPIYEGIEPDQEVSWDGRGQDPQLARALRLLQSKAR